MGRKKFFPLAIGAYLSHYESERPVDWTGRFGNAHPLDLEIGSGLGEFLVRNAVAHPERNFVGIEQEWERVKKFLRRIEYARRDGADAAANIRVLQVDATVALERLFKPSSIDRIYCLFPCPWPKKGHIKHRLFSSRFLRLVNNRLCERGDVQIVTDFLPYRDWVLEQIDGTGFDADARTVQPRFGTKFERKWHAQGQREFHEIILKKTAHLEFPVKEDIELKIYFAPEFDPQQFRFEEMTGEVTVVMKEFLYDRDRRKAMVHLVAAEENIAQHVWVTVAKTSRGWRIAKAEGQTVLPTQSVAKAINLVYQAVVRSRQVVSNAEHASNEAVNDEEMG